MARALGSAFAVSLLIVSGAAGTGAQTPKRGGTLVFRMIGPEPACLNVLDSRCVAVPSARSVADVVLAKPYDVGPDFTFQPKLANVTFTKKPPFALTYHIQPEARWSDGTPITARDFIFTLRTIRAHGTELDREFHRVVRRILALDSKTVRVVLRPRHGGWRALFGNVLPAHALGGEDVTKVWSDRIDNPKTRGPIASGPFLVERWVRGRQLVLRRNPNYWGRHPAYLERLVIRFAPSPDDPTEALRRGEFDVATGVRPEFVPTLRREPGIRISATRTSGVEHFSLRLGRGGHPALKSKLVRRALAFGIDRVALVRELYGDIDSTWGPLDSALFPAQGRYYEENWSGYRYRPAHARRLLEQAGCARGDDRIYACAGSRLSLRFVTTAGNRTRERVLSLVQAQLREAGVEVVPTFATPAAVFGQIVPNGAFDAALFSWLYSPDSVGFAGVYGCGGAQNFSGYCQRLVTAELNQAERILDELQRARALNRADRRIARDVPAIPLFQFVLTAAYDARVRNYAMPPLSPFWNAENWWLER